MSKQIKPLPRFKTEAEERAFWEARGRDSTEYLASVTTGKFTHSAMKPDCSPA